MMRQILLSTMCATALLILTADGWGRGFGGGGRGGGARGGAGGFGGGVGRSPGGFGGGGFSGGGMQRSAGGFAGGGMQRSAGGFSGGAGRSGGGFANAGAQRGGQRATAGGDRGRGSSGFEAAGGRSPGGLAAGGAGAAGSRGGERGFAGASGTAGFASRGGASSAGARDRFSSPSQNDLNGFLGLPSDGGLHGLSGSRPSDGGNFEVNRGTAEGPRGGQAGGIAVTGPQGNTAGRAVGIGAEGGVAAAGGVRGAEGGAVGRGAAVGADGQAIAAGGVRGPEGGAAARGAAVGADGRVAAVGGVRGPEGGAAARGAAVGSDGRVAAVGGVRGPEGGAVARGAYRGPAGAAAGFARVTPSGRYTNAVAVRGSFNHWGLYGRDWYVGHPAAWYPAAWTAGAAWRVASWNSLATWMDYGPTAPLYYDYGNNVTYSDNSVYVDGQDAGSPQQYSEQASTLAQVGATADAPADGEWMPLGVFALTKTGESDSIVTIQLAVNKEGVIRGNYTDTKTDQSRVIQGSVDKQTQRVAFTVGDNKSNLIETGLYNLTKDEAPALVHVGDNKTEQWLLVRLQPPGQPAAGQGTS